MSKRFIPAASFENGVENFPLISLDFIVMDPERKQFLVGRRTNNPAKGSLFVPGGRIQKNETIQEAFKRVSKMELGRKISIEQAQFIGLYQHFYPTGFGNVETGTHYLANGFVVPMRKEDIDLTRLPRSQHSEYMWVAEDEIFDRKDLHPNTARYIKTYKTIRKLEPAARKAINALVHMPVIFPENAM